MGAKDKCGARAEGHEPEFNGSRFGDHLQTPQTHGVLGLGV